MSIFKGRKKRNVSEGRHSEAKSDYDKIQVTSEGDFFMSSKDIFNDEKESLDLINRFRKSTRAYKARDGKFISSRPAPKNNSGDGTAEYYFTN